MLHLTFILDGSEMISSDELGQRPLEGVERAILLVHRNHVRRRLDNRYCLEHGQLPRITAAGPTAERLTFTVQGCCQQLVNDVTKTLEADPSKSPAAAGLCPAEPLMVGQASRKLVGGNAVRFPGTTWSRPLTERDRVAGGRRTRVRFSPEEGGYGHQAQFAGAARGRGALG